jgi:tetratricopeptide (TPR) repeat protein
MRLDLLAKLGRNAEGLPWLEQKSQADPLNVNLKMLLATEYAAAGSNPKAIDVYKALVADTPSEEAYRAYFKLLSDTDRAGGRKTLELLDAAMRVASKKPPIEGTARAANQFRAMLAVLREDAPLGRGVVDAAGMPNAIGAVDYHTHFFLAMLADQHGRLEHAERFYKTALLARDPEDEATLYQGLFNVLWRRHKYDVVAREAIDGLSNARNTNPILFHTELARARTRQGRLQEAEAAADRALAAAADRDRIFCMHLKVQVLIQDRRFAEAEKFAKKLLDESTLPGDVQKSRYMLSGVYSAWKKMDKCEAELLTILKYDPNDVTANNDLGYVWADQSKNLPEAEAMIRKAIDLDREQRKTKAVLDKDNAAYIDSLGWLLFRRGDVEGALKELERAVALPDGDDPALWDHLGDVYFRLERYTEALNSWQRSVELYETERMRPQDERFQDVKRKLKTARELVKSR